VDPDDAFGSGKHGHVVPMDSSDFGKYHVYRI